MAGSLPYSSFNHFVCWQVSELVNSFRTAFLLTRQYKCVKSLIQLYLFLDEGYKYGTNIIQKFGLLKECTILSIHVISLICILIPQQKQP